MKSDSYSSLVNRLSDSFSNCGEVMDAKFCAEIISTFEMDENAEFSPDEIRRAVREASDNFVDSITENCHANWESDCKYKPKYPRYESESHYEADIVRYEAMRPRNVRKAIAFKALSI